MPVTSTFSPVANTSAWITWPMVKAELSSTRISARCLAGAWLAFLKWPVSGLLTRRGLTSPKASWMAEYPSRSGVFTWTTRQGPAWMTVTGTALFCSSQICVRPIFWPRMPLLFAIALRLLDLDDPTGAHGAPALADSEAQAFLHGDRIDEFDRHLGVVAGHDHLSPAREVDAAGDVGRTEVELRPVVVEERRVPPALLLGQY